MKWIFYVIVFIYMFYRAVYGVKIKEIGRVSIENIKKEDGKKFFLPGGRKTINCTAESKNQKIEWIDPTGNVVKRNPANRVYVESSAPQSKFQSLARTRVSSLVLVFKSLSVDDTGVWQCQAGDVKQNTSLCVINPSRLAEIPTVNVDSGRSITLSCKAKGDPEPRVLWYRNGELITDDTSTKYQVMTKYNTLDSEGLLTITSLGAEDTGSYTCDAIQESPTVDDCTHIESMNVSLQVNHAPIFKDGNDTEIVYGTEGESVELVCSASGYPTPTYKWLKDVDGTSSELSQDKVQLINGGTEAVLTLAGDSFSFDERYRCRATNLYGDVYKPFVLRMTEAPTKPNDVRPHSECSDKIQLEINWNNEISFPVNSIDVQYFKVRSLKGRKPSEFDWKRSKLQKLIPDNLDFKGVNVTLSDLDENTKYYIRLRAVNTEGKSQWSEAVQDSTIEKLDDSEDPNELSDCSNSKTSTSKLEDTTEAPKTSSVSDSTFYGIFFAGGVAIIAIASMFLMRMV